MLEFTLLFYYHYLFLHIVFIVYYNQTLLFFIFHFSKKPIFAQCYLFSRLNLDPHRCKLRINFFYSIFKKLLPVGVWVNDKPYSPFFVGKFFSIIILCYTKTKNNIIFLIFLSLKTKSLNKSALKLNFQNVITKKHLKNN